jgi:alkylation response protein AidB-like acyl-CoA dehydrogenase
MDERLFFEDHHLELREMVRGFARAEIAPIARAYDASAEFPWPTVRKMADLGLLGVPWPEELGGAGMDYLSYIITVHELCKVDASHGLTVSAHTNLGTSPIVEFGTEEQRRRWVPALASGKVLGGFGLTEPGAGSDAGGTATTATPQGSDWVLNGSKIFITHAGVGEVFVVTARTTPGRGTRGITSFILCKDTVDLPAAREHGIGHEPALPRTPGVRAGKKEDKMGWRASDTRELYMENCRVPGENLLGPVGEGFVQFLKTLDAGRIGIAAVSLGIAEGAYEQALKYSTERKQFGRYIASFQGVHFALADMATEIEAGKLLLYSAALLKQRGLPHKTEAAMAKLFCSELAMRVTIKAVQVHGGYGYTTEYPVERMMRDAKVCEIGEGTSEIQRLVIARQILGDLLND